MFDRLKKKKKICKQPRLSVYKSFGYACTDVKLPIDNQIYTFAQTYILMICITVQIYVEGWAPSNMLNPAVTSQKPVIQLLSFVAVNHINFHSLFCLCIRLLVYSLEF